MKYLTCIVFLGISISLFAQYPSDARVISDVKAKNPSEFKTVKTTGSWYLTHENIPDWQKPNAAERPIYIEGAKNSSGEWWEYSGTAIYNMNGSSYNFNRVFIFEEPRLRGVKLPDNAFFIDLFKNILSSKEQLFMMMNYNVANAVNFYSIELSDEPWVTGNKWKIGHSLATSGLLSVEMALLMLTKQETYANPFAWGQPPNKVNKIMVNASGFGGNNISIIVSLP